jgi:hypothetical protein
MSDIENGVKELYRIFKDNSYLHDQEFTDMVIEQVGIKSQNKNLVLICESIIDLLKLPKE